MLAKSWSLERGRGVTGWEIELDESHPRIEAELSV